MAKIPKTLTFHEDVARLVQAYADKRGSNFQRVVQAAVLQFFFSETDGPDPDWMATFVELEKGHGDPPLDLSRVPMKFWEERAGRLERKLAGLRQLYANKEPKTPDHAKARADAIKNFQKSILWAHSEAGIWRTGIELSGGGVDGAIQRAIASSVEHEALEKRIERLVTESETDDNE